MRFRNLTSNFLPESVPGGKRKDGKDIIATFRARGYQVARNTAELDAANGTKLLGLFAGDDMDFEIDRDPAREPTTAEMTVAALKALSRESSANSLQPRYWTSCSRCTFRVSGSTPTCAN